MEFQELVVIFGIILILVVLGRLIRRMRAPKEAGIEITGTIIEKSFNPPPGAPVDYWCYLMVQTASGQRFSIHLDRKQVHSITIGDQIRFILPKKVNKSVKVEIIAPYGG